MARTYDIGDFYNIIEELNDSEEDYLIEQADKVEGYIIQFEANMLPEQLCRSYIQDVRDLIELDNIRGKIKNKVLAQKAMDEITKLLMKGIAAAIKMGV